MATAEALDRLRDLDARHHLHPFTTHHELAARGTRVITRAEGCYVYEADGRRLLDGMSGLWCVQVGYGRRELIEAATRQLETLPFYNTFFQCAHPPAIELAARLAELTPPGLDRIFYAGSGSEANDSVVKIVRYFWNLMGRPEKKTIISRRYGYHGVTVAAASMSGMTPMHGLFDLPLPGFAHVETPYQFELGGGEDAAAFGRRIAHELERKILGIGADKVAAFIGEPVQGAGGVVIPPASYWPEIERICRAHDVLLIADEVITGFGRTGDWFGCQTFGFTPDIMTMAKGLSSGYQPIAAVALGARVGAAVFTGKDEFTHGFTYSGHPVACAVALANIEVIEREGLATRAAGPLGAHFAAALGRLADHPLVGEVRTKGLLGAVELVADKTSRTRFQPVGRAGMLTRDACVRHGLVMRAVRDVMIIAPPLVITEAEIDEAADKARRALDDTLGELRHEMAA